MKKPTPPDETLAQFLHRKFLELEAQTGYRLTLGYFARYLGIRQPSLSGLMNDAGREPTVRLIRQIATRYPDVYRVVGIPVPAESPGQPDPDLSEVLAAWPHLTKGMRETILRSIHESIASEEPSKTHDNDDTPSGQRSGGTPGDPRRMEEAI